LDQFLARWKAITRSDNGFFFASHFPGPTLFAGDEVVFHAAARMRGSAFLPERTTTARNLFGLGEDLGSALVIFGGSDFVSAVKIG
jgi:hypothetical protein